MQHCEPGSEDNRECCGKLLDQTFSWKDEAQFVSAHVANLVAARLDC